MLLLDNREVKKGWQTLKDGVTGLFQKHGAEVLSGRRWDERRLAYPIRRQHQATYLLCYYKADTSTLVAIRRELEYTEPVLRHLTVQCEEVPASAFEPEAEFDESQVKIEEDTYEVPRPAQATEETARADGEPAKATAASASDEVRAEAAGDTPPATGGDESAAPPLDADEPDKKPKDKKPDDEKEGES